MINEILKLQVEEKKKARSRNTINQRRKVLGVEGSRLSGLQNDEITEQKMRKAKTSKEKRQKVNRKTSIRNILILKQA